MVIEVIRTTIVNAVLVMKSVNHEDEKKELIERDTEELMQQAASDELFLADLNETMEDFGHADQEDHEFLTMDRLAG